METDCSVFWTKSSTGKEQDESKAVGWYHKTDFAIKAVIDGEEFSYDGRFDIGDGEGDLIAHIRNFLRILPLPGLPVHPGVETAGRGLLPGAYGKPAVGTGCVHPLSGAAYQTDPRGRIVLAELWTEEQTED